MHPSPSPLDRQHPGGELLRKSLVVRRDEQRPSLTVSLRSNAPSSARREGSSDAIGSSISSTGGFTASARAMATRCASPPDSSRGRASARDSTPSCVSKSRAGLLRSVRAARHARAPARGTRSATPTCARTDGGIETRARRCGAADAAWRDRARGRRRAGRRRLRSSRSQTDRAPRWRAGSSSCRSPTARAARSDRRAALRG